MQLVQRQLAEPGLALSPALLFGDLAPWAADAALMALLQDVASGQGEVKFLDTTVNLMHLNSGIVLLAWLRDDQMFQCKGQSWHSVFAQF